MKRRDLLQASVAAYLASLGLPLIGISDAAFAQSLQKKIADGKGGGAKAEQDQVLPSSNAPLIVVFLRGGADGLSFLSPLDDPDFLAARPPEMRFIPSGFNTNPIMAGGTPLYWHPSTEPLSQLYQSGRLIPWVAVGFSDETRSHFEAQEIMERGVSSLQSLPDALGWMARQEISRDSRFNSKPKSGQFTLPLFAANNNQPRSMQGATEVLTVKDLMGGMNFPGGPASFRAIESLCQAESSHAVSPFMLRTAKNIDTLNQSLPKNPTDGKVLPYVSSGAITYPNSDPAVGLRSVARLLQAKVGLQYAWVDHEGWDTHEYQNGRISNLLKDLSGALAAFDSDMQAQKQAYSLVVMTEFGRRLRSNRSNGTDHGHGSLAFVMGSSVQGGKVMGNWPGLTSDKLDRGVDLAVTTDYREVLRRAIAWS